MRLLFPIALLAFISLGLPDGVLGVAWPSMRRTFDVPLSHLGILLGAATVGYLASSFSSGPLVAHLRIGRLLLVSSGVMAVSLLSYAVAPGWPTVIAGGVLGGLGGGAIDAGVNAFAASRCSPRQTAWLHASYGVGAMLGPLLMTALLATGTSWRWGYVVIAGAVAAMALAFAMTLDRWPASADRSAAAAGVPDLVDTLRRPRVIVHVALFFLYTGLEVSAGQWSYSFLTEARGVAPTAAGLWVSVYWASLTIGRVALGTVARVATVDAMLRASMALAPLAALLVWLGDSRIGAPVGLVALGLALAPVYPLLVSATPGRLGAGHAVHAIGVQVAAAYLGAAAVPGTIGLLARDVGLEVIGPALVAVAVGVLVLHEVVLRQPRPRSPDAVPVQA
jgi:fucose permease